MGNSRVVSMMCRNISLESDWTGKHDLFDILYTIKSEYIVKTIKQVQYQQQN